VLANGPATGPPRGFASVWWKLYPLGALGAAGAGSYIDPRIGLVMVVVSITPPTVIALVVLVTVIFGGKEKREAMFRLLRQIFDPQSGRHLMLTTADQEIPEGSRNGSSRNPYSESPCQG
jgi:hypothetical protein